MTLIGRFDLRGRAGALFGSGLRSGARMAAGRSASSPGAGLDGTESPVTGSRTGAGAADGVPHQAAGAKLRELLLVADQQDEEAGRAALLHQAVDHLVPDEARILDTLAARRPTEPALPLVHIFTLTGTGLPGEPLLENASSVGRAAGVTLPRLTPYYVGRLVSLGLVEIGPEDDRLDDEYRALLADPTVLAAMSRARDAGATPRVIRHTLALSLLGHELCADAAS